MEYLPQQAGNKRFDLQPGVIIQGSADGVKQYYSYFRSLEAAEEESEVIVIINTARRIGVPTIQKLEGK